VEKTETQAHYAPKLEMIIKTRWILMGKLNK